MFEEKQVFTLSRPNKVGINDWKWLSNKSRPNIIQTC